MKTVPAVTFPTLCPIESFVSFVSEAASRLRVEVGVAADNVQSLGLRATREALSSRRVSAMSGRRLGGSMSRGVARAARAGSPRCSGDDEGRDEELQAIVAGGEKPRQTSLANCWLVVWDGAGSDMVLSSLPTFSYP